MGNMITERNCAAGERFSILSISAFPVKYHGYIISRRSIGLDHEKTS